MNYPTHLQCPYCPAQAYPAMLRGSIDGHLGYPTKPVRLYTCPQKHKFYIHPEVQEALNVVVCKAA